MLADAREIPEGETLEADVCIVGAGAAGISVARELIGSGLDVYLLESGGLARDAAAQALSAAENAGEPYWPLDGNRERGVGGTTSRWAGWARPLDELDLEQRDWVPHSGWPLDGAQLAPFYARAHKVCQIDGFDYDLSALERRRHARRLPLPETEVVTRMYRLSPPTRFGRAYLGELRAAANVELLTHGTVTSIETNPDGTAVTRLAVACLAGARFALAPRYTILAAGAIENARLLLLSTSAHQRGLGNGHDLVGRFFMEHPHFPAGELSLARPLSTALYRPDATSAARLFLPPELQRREGLLNYNLMLEQLPASNTLGRVARRLGRGPRRFRLHHTLEQAPDPQSRVELGPARDELGLPRARLHWRTGELERRTFSRSQELIGEAFARAGLGRLERGALAADGAWPILQGELGHHMGTTRMHADPRHGVVDADARVHGVHNLFVAGSSVFPTAGSGTPTITIVALSLRLADHVRALASTRDAARAGSA